MSESGVPVIKHSVPPDDARSILTNVARIEVDKVGIFGAYHLALARGTNPDSFRGDDPRFARAYVSGRL